MFWQELSGAEDYTDNVADAILLYVVVAGQLIALVHILFEMRVYAGFYAC